MRRSGPGPTFLSFTYRVSARGALRESLGPDNVLTGGGLLLSLSVASLAFAGGASAHPVGAGHLYSPGRKRQHRYGDPDRVHWGYGRIRRQPHDWRHSRSFDDDSVQPRRLGHFEHEHIHTSGCSRQDEGVLALLWNDKERERHSRQVLIAGPLFGDEFPRVRLSDRVTGMTGR